MVDESNWIIEQSFANSDVSSFLAEMQKRHRVLPAKENYFKAFRLCSLSDTKVVILGQDPYPNPAHAHGLCFSVPSGTTPLPASLNNIFRAMQYDLGTMPTDGNLSYLATQGVLLLNSILTVNIGAPLSHQNRGWETLTNAVIKQINEQKQNVVFLLWGGTARQKSMFIDRQKHLILTSAHPSPLSAHLGFLTCKHFSKTNDYLSEHNITPINWC